MTRPVRLCADPATLERRLLASPERLLAKLAEAEATIARLRAELEAQEDLGLTITETRMYAALKRAGTLTSEQLAEAGSTARRKIATSSVKTLAYKLRKALAAAGEPWTIEGLKDGRWHGGGYRLVPVEVTA